MSLVPNLRSQSSIVRFASLVFAAAAFISCTAGRDIQLHTTPADAPQPASPGDGSGPKPGIGDASGGATTRSSYRVFCEFPDGGDGLLMTTSSLARPWDRNPSLQVSDQAVDGSELREFRALTPVHTESVTTKLLFDAQLVNANGTRGARSIYLASVDLSAKQGTARVMAPSQAVDAGAQALANRLGLELASFGTSSGARFLILPSGSSYSILSAGDFSKVGSLTLSPQTTFFPAIDENMSLFTALSYTGGRFVPVVIPLDLSQANAVTAQAALSVPVGGGGVSALPLQSWLGGRLAWAEVPMNAIGSRLDLAVWNPKGGALLRQSYTPEAGAKVAPAAAALDLQGSSLMAVAIEKVNSTPGAHGARATVKVDFAKLVFLSLTDAGLSKASDLDYPSDVVSEIESGGLQGFGSNFALGGLVSSPDRQALFFLLPKQGTEMVFQYASGAIQGAGLNACAHPALLKEEY